MHKMHLLDIQIDFFLPLWRRVLVVLVCLGWAVFEFVNMALPWGMLFGGLGLYAGWRFFFDGWPVSPYEERNLPADNTQNE